MSQEVPVSSTKTDTVSVTPNTLDERINAATVEDHQSVLDEIAQITNPITGPFSHLKEKNSEIRNHTTAL